MLIIARKMKIYQKKDKSKNDKNKVVGSYRITIPREIMEALELKEGDKMMWVANKEIGSAFITKAATKSLHRPLKP